MEQEPEQSAEQCNCLTHQVVRYIEALKAEKSFGAAHLLEQFVQVATQGWDGPLGDDSPEARAAVAAFGELADEWGQGHQANVRAWVAQLTRLELEHLTLSVIAETGTAAAAMGMRL